MMFVKAVRNQMVPPCAEWGGQPYRSAVVQARRFSVWPHCPNTGWNRCQDLNSFILGELETTGTPSYYMDEDYPAGPEIQ